VSDSQDRTLPATPARRAEAIEQGSYPTVADPASLLSLAALMTVLATILPRWSVDAADLFRACLATGPLAAGGPSAGSWSAVGADAPIDCRATAARLTALTFAAIVVPAAVAVALHLLVDRPGFRPARSAPAFRRVNPARGFVRLFAGAVPRTLAGLGTAILCGAAGLMAIESVMRLAARTAPPSAGVAFGAGLRATGLVLAGCTAVAIVRFLWARRQFERSIRMTPQEFEEERRRLEPASAIDWRARRSAVRAGPRAGGIAQEAAASEA